MEYHRCRTSTRHDRRLQTKWWRCRTINWRYDVELNITAAWITPNVTNGAELSTSVAGKLFNAADDVKRNGLCNHCLLILAKRSLCVRCRARRVGDPFWFWTRYDLHVWRREVGQRVDRGALLGKYVNECIGSYPSHNHCLFISARTDHKSQPKTQGTIWSLSTTQERINVRATPSHFCKGD